MPTGVLHDRAGVILEIGDMIIQSCLPKYMEVEINGKKEEGSTKESVGRMYKGVGTIWFEKRGCVQSKETA